MRVTIFRTYWDWSLRGERRDARQAAPNQGFHYGLKGSSILAALANAVILLVAVGAIMLEAIRRFLQPQRRWTTVIAVAAVGILINGATAMMFARGRRGDLNFRGAYCTWLPTRPFSAAVVVAGGSHPVWTHQQ